jgi:hypothetical protein
VTLQHLPLADRQPAMPADTLVLEDDETMIDMDSDYETGAWCESLGCSPHQLRMAVAAVGPSPSKVQDYLALQYLAAQ